MIKQHKKMLILTSVITLLPIFIGLLLWRQLPASVATHFGVDNQPDGYCSKAGNDAVFSSYMYSCN